MENIRCGTCRALLFRAGRGAISGVIEIKCRRLRHPECPEADRAPIRAPKSVPDLETFVFLERKR